MISWQGLLGLAAAALLIPALRGAVKKHRERKNRDFTRKLEMVLLPRETVKLICPGRDGTWILTSRRLLREVGAGFTAIPLTSLKSVRGWDKAGKRTADVSKMETLTLKADREWRIRKTDTHFPDLCKALLRNMEKKKAGAAGKKG